MEEQSPANEGDYVVAIVDNQKKWQNTDKMNPASNEEECVVSIVDHGNEDAESQQKAKNTVVTRNWTRNDEIEKREKKQAPKKAEKVNEKAVAIATKQTCQKAKDK